MSYKTILVHVDLSCHAPPRMRYAASLARAYGARLIGAAMLGVSRDIFPHGYRAAPGTLEAGYFEPLAENVRRALAHFEAIADKIQTPHASRFLCDHTDHALMLQARFADLVVVSQDDPAESMPDMAIRLPDALILECARPVLVVPRTDPAPYRDPHILVAWDGSKEACAAMSAAMPLLRHASDVTVVMLTGPQRTAEDCRAEQSELQAFLATHQVTPRVLVHRAQDDTGHALLGLAKDFGCGLLVMGCYGHSRFREFCLGGPSRTVLAEADIPLLLAH